MYIILRDFAGTLHFISGRDEVFAKVVHAAPSEEAGEDPASGKTQRSATQTYDDALISQADSRQVPQLQVQAVVASALVADTANHNGNEAGAEDKMNAQQESKKHNKIIIHTFFEQKKSKTNEGVLAVLVCCFTSPFLHHLICYLYNIWGAVMMIDDDDDDGAVFLCGASCLSIHAAAASLCLCDTHCR